MNFENSTIYFLPIAYGDYNKFISFNTNYITFVILHSVVQLISYTSSMRFALGF